MVSTGSLKTVLHAVVYRSATLKADKRF